jgi:hypothetical protein
MRPSLHSHVSRTYAVLEGKPMNVARLFSCLAACLLLTLASHPTIAQQASPDPSTNACGSTETNYTVKASPSNDAPTEPPPRKALVYIIETMPDYHLATTKVNIGLDGAWVGATSAYTHLSFVVTQGTHNLCAVYQGHADTMDDEGHTLVLRLNAQAGNIYYFRYHALFLKDSPGIAFFDPIDEEEGKYLVWGTNVANSTVKSVKK